MPDPGEIAKRARVFFALWPDAEPRRALAALTKSSHARYGGRMTRPETIHLTLVFLGSIERDRLPDVIASAQGALAGRFEIGLDRLDCWRHNKIAFLAPEMPPKALLDLVARIEAGLAERNIPYDRRPYRPHVTLLRHARCPSAGQIINARPEPALLWPVREFVLVESKLSPAGASYTPLARFELS